MKTLVLVEHEGGAIKDATYATVTAASVASFTDALSCSTRTRTLMPPLPMP